MSFRRAARTDANQNEIVELFRNLGWSVLIISQLKKCCDLFVAKNGKTIAIEVKDGSKCESQKKLTEGELEFKENWQGDYEIVYSTECVLKINKNYMLA